MEQLTFQISLAEKILRVTCQYPSTRDFCREYLVSEDCPPDLILTLTPELLERQRAFFQRKGMLRSATAPEYLEKLVLCRQAAQAFPRFDRVLFHGSAMAFRGQGILFTAKSGTGKSTHTRLWRQQFGPDVTMVNDDKPFLSISEDGVRVHGSPWQGKHELGSPISAPLKAICILCRGEENRIAPISPRDALPMLLQQTYQPQDPAAMVKTLQLVEALSQGVALYRLECNMDPQAAVTACRGMGLCPEKETSYETEA